jgi:hypothetical protein
MLKLTKDTLKKRGSRGALLALPPHLGERGGHTHNFTEIEPKRFYAARRSTSRFGRPLSLCSSSSPVPTKLNTMEKLRSST